MADCTACIDSDLLVGMECSAHARERRRSAAICVVVPRGVHVDEAGFILRAHRKAGDMHTVQHRRETPTAFVERERPRAYRCARVVQRGERLEAHQTPVKLGVVLVRMLLPVIFIVLVAPAVPRLRRHFTVSDFCK